MSLPVKHAIAELQAEMLTMPQVECEVFHHFAEGTYTRELHIPAGTTLVGKIHLHSTINILAKGRIAVVTDDGKKYEIEAPYTFVSAAGTRKAGHAVEDTVWINVHPWSGPEDLELIEQAVIAREALDLKES